MAPKKNPKKKKPLSGYMLFCKQERPKIVKAHPNFTFAEVGKALGAAWRELSEAKKDEYKKKAKYEKK